MMKDKFDELVETLFSSSLIFSHHINLETFFSRSFFAAHQFVVVVTSNFFFLSLILATYNVSIYQ